MPHDTLSIRADALPARAAGQAPATQTGALAEVVGIQHSFS
jgi:hypothetical protein